MLIGHIGSTNWQNYLPMCDVCGLRAWETGQTLNGDWWCSWMSQRSIWMHQMGNSESVDMMEILLTLPMWTRKCREVELVSWYGDAWPHMVLASFIMLKAPLILWNILKSSKILYSHLWKTTTYPLLTSSYTGPTDHTWLQNPLPTLESELFPGLPIHQTWTSLKMSGTSSRTIWKIGHLNQPLKTRCGRYLRRNGQSWGVIIVSHYTGVVQGGSMPFGMQEEDTLSTNVQTKFGRNLMHQHCIMTWERLDGPVLKTIKITNPC